MTEIPSESHRGRAVSDRLRQAETLRARLIIQAGGVLGLILIAVVPVVPGTFWKNLSGGVFADLPVATTILAAGATLLLGGMASWAFVFLRYGRATPASTIRLLRQLQGGSLNFGSDESGPVRDPDGEEDLVEDDDEEFDDDEEELEPSEAFIGRLSEEIAAQGNRANLNLIVGGVTAIVALGFLVWLTVDTTSRLEQALAPQVGIETSRPPQLAAYLYWAPFASKVFMSSTAAFFAFFFLSTYRRNLAEIRYFHNELTNVESRLVAVDLCDETPEGQKTKREILKAMAATERNFILRKGESTTDLSQKEMDRLEMAALVEAIVKATSHKGGEKG